MDGKLWAERCREIREALAEAAARGGYAAPRLMAVTKRVPDECFLAAVASGMDVGENYPQAFARRWELAQTAGLDVSKLHLIGSLQTNKVKLAVGRACLIHSVDSLRLAQQIDRQSERAGVLTHVLLEVNSGRETSKGGLVPEEVPGVARQVAGLAHLRLRGLMTMGPKCEDPEDLRPCFRETRRLLDELCGEGLFVTADGREADGREPGRCPILSMGMSDSYRIAAEEGSTLVRLGSALFAGVDTAPPAREADETTRIG